MVLTPMSDAVAFGVAKALPELSAGAPRYGTTDLSTAVNAEAAALTAQFTDGMIDAGRLLKNKASRLDLAFSENSTAHKWYDYAGSIHGAIKEPIKRAEFARSLFRRTADAITKGEDVNDMSVRLRLNTEAYKDALGGISMQDNAITSGWNAGLRSLEQVDKATGKPRPIGVFLSTVLRADTPVTKAPTNIVLEASEYIGGLLSGGTKAAWAYAHGIEDLQPIERDMIIRQMSRGAVGAALGTLYFFKHDLIQFGGFYDGKKRKESDVPEGAARVGSVTIPKMLLHHPLYDALQYSASLARVTESPKGDHGLARATMAATVGLADELPMVHTAEDMAKILAAGGTGMDALDRTVAGKVVPGVVQWVAKKMDNDTKRKPKGLVQHLEANIPGLRQKVPKKQSSGNVIL